MLGEDVKSWFTHKRRGLRTDNLCLVDGSEDGSSPAQTSWKEVQPHVKRFTVYTIGTKKKKKIVNSECFLLPFLISVYCDTTLCSENVLTFAYSLLLLTLRIKTLTVRVENSWCGFQKTLNVRLEIGPLIREFATPLQKDFFFFLKSDGA